MKKLLLILLGGFIPSILYAQNTDSLIQNFLIKSQNDSKLIFQKEAGLIATDSANSTLELLERNSNRIIKLPVKGRWSDLIRRGKYFLLYEKDNIRHSEFGNMIGLRVIDVSTLHQVLEDGVIIRSYGIIGNYIFSKALNGEEMDGGFVVRKLEENQKWLLYFNTYKSGLYSAVKLNPKQILLLKNYSREITGNFYPPKYKYGIKLFSYDIPSNTFMSLDSLPNRTFVDSPPSGENMWNYSNDHIGFFLEKIRKKRIFPDSTFYYEYYKGKVHLKSVIWAYLLSSFRIENDLYSITSYRGVYRFKNLSTGAYVDFDTSQLPKRNYIYLFRIACAQKISNNIIYVAPETLIADGKPTKPSVLKINFARKSVQIVNNAILWNKRIFKLNE